MKLLIFLAGVFVLTVSADSCGKKTKSTNQVYKAKLQVKALCMNYTLSVTDGAVDSSLVVPSWTDETTGKSYTNAFGLSNPCNFPATIKEGDEFNFVIDTAKTSDCAVCMAFYPTPPKKLSIRVVE